MSGAQIVAIAAWLSFLAAPWYGLLTAADPRELGPVVVISLVVGLVAGLQHAGAVARRAKTVAALAQTMQQEAAGRMDANAAESRRRLNRLLSERDDQERQ